MQNRRNLLTAAGTGAVASLLLSSTRRTMAQTTTPVFPTDTNTVPTDPFILLLRGIYEPVTSGPNLGMPEINLSDGSYSKTKIYPVFGVPDAQNAQGNQEQSNNNVPTTPIGNFYVQIQGSLCAYDLPHGAIAMTFLPAPPGALPGFNGFVPFPDGQGGAFLEGTFELNIIDATGIYKPFVGGHNHMVDRLHSLANGQLDEFCFCNISKYPFPPCSSSNNTMCQVTS